MTNPLPSKAPNYLRMACTSASVGFREKLSQDELLNALLTGEVPSNRCPHFRKLLQEVPDALVKGLIEQLGGMFKPDEAARNLAKIAEILKVRKPLQRIGL